jgi:muconolactone delta-isomerase
VEFLVTMTTNVPAGTRDEAIDEVRGREAARSRELAVGGNLRRLWRPPLKPGEWRTLGLFAADDADELERLLASMPLRVWRTDEVTPLSPHSNDPALSGPGSGQEFLITMTIAVPEGTSSAAVDDTKKREAQCARELAARVTSSGCGRCPPRPATGAPSVYGTRAMPEKWTVSWNHFRSIPG